MNYDFKQIAEGARSFYNVGLLHLTEPKKWPVGPPAIPFYVDIAFACELFMKAIITYHTPDISKSDYKKLGHRLDKLFVALPLETQKEIKDNIPDCKVQEIQKKAI